MRYTVTGDTIGLETKAFQLKYTPSVFMLEVNPREPGYNGRIAIIWIFGVDYYALHLYRYIEDTWHYRAATPPILNVAQHMSVPCAHHAGERWQPYFAGSWY